MFNCTHNSIKKKKIKACQSRGCHRSLHWGLHTMLKPHYKGGQPRGIWWENQEAQEKKTGNVHALPARGHLSSRRMVVPAGALRGWQKIMLVHSTDLQARYEYWLCLQSQNDWGKVLPSHELELYRATVRADLGNTVTAVYTQPTSLKSLLLPLPMTGSVEDTHLQN